MDNPEATKVTAAIIIEGGRVLIARRPPGGRHPGAWEFPGGKVEPGETPEVCLARELDEELGIIVKVGEKLAEIRHVYPDRAIDLQAFECTIESGRPRDLACSEHAWVKSGDLGAYDLLPADVKLLEALPKRC